MRTLLFTSAFLVLLSCQTEKDPIVISNHESHSTTSIIQPIKGLEIPVRTFKIDPHVDAKIELPNGGSIEFKANSFVDENGQPVEGEIDIKWKEYHSLTDILLSGIPMKYDSAGVSFDFVSGGMFTIDALNNGNSVDLAEGKKATVNLASYEDTPCFNFYELNEQTGEWSYETTKNGTAINEKPSEAIKKNTKNDILDIQVDVSKFPELRKQTIVAWEAKDKLSNKVKKELINELNKVEAIKTEQGQILLHISNLKLDTLIRVSPITLESALKQKEELMNEMDADFAELLEYQNNYDAGKVIRSIEIDGMGTYNWDKVLEREKQTYLAASFNLNKDVRPEFTSVFFLSPKENVVIKCNSRGDTQFNFDPSLPNFLVAILPDNSVMIVDKKEFALANDLVSGSKHEFNFKDLNVQVESPLELSDLLKGILTSKS